MMPKLPNLLKRTVFGALYVAISCFMILANEWTCIAFMIICDIIIMYEFMKMFNVTKIRTFFVSIASILILSLIAINDYKIKIILGIVSLIMLLCIFIIQLLEHTEKPEIKIGIPLTGLLYITLPFACSIHFSFESRYIIMAVFILIWVSDTMAYLVGCRFGKHRLYERISPKKSWEGAIGGVVFSIVASLFFNKLFPTLEISVLIWGVIGLSVGIFGIIGDLIESMFKRSANIKDSGKIIPGHGGLFDRLDSYLFTIPWIWILLFVIEIW